MQKETDRIRRKKEETREEDEIGIFHAADGSMYEGRVSRREIPVETPMGLPTGTSAPAATLRGQMPPELVPQMVVIQHGKGVFKDAGGTIYDGDWVEGVMSGEGVLRFPSGATYTGGMRGNEFYGTGTYTWPDGSYYEGQWENNKMHGLGTYADDKGVRWVGKFYRGAGVGLLAEIHL